MKKIFQKIYSISIIVLILYTIISIIHLSWYIADPKGFFGFNYFIEVTRVILTLLLIIIVILFGGWLLIYSLKSLIEGKSSIKELFKILGVISLIVVMTAFNSIWASGISFLFASELSEKYSLINQTEEYLNDGKTEKALQLAIKSYQKEQKRNVSWFFVLTKLYSKIEYDKKEKLLSKYSSTLNYGYCLNQIIANNETGQDKFQEAIEIANSSLLIEEKNELLVFPLAALAEIHLNSKKFKEADKYFEQLSQISRELESDDVEYAINSYMLFSSQAMAFGDFKKSTRLLQEALKVYEKSDLSRTSNNYLSLIHIVAIGEIYNENFTKAGDLLLKAESIVQNRDDKPIYLNHLFVKGNYCFYSSLSEQGDERILKKGFWEKVTSSSEKDLTLNEKLLNCAEECFSEMVEKSKELSGNNSSRYINAKLTLSNYFYLTSQFKKAKLGFNEVLSILDKSKKENEDLYYQVYLQNLLNERQISQININELNALEKFFFNKLTTNYEVLTEEQREKYTVSLQKQIDRINEFYIIEDSDKSRKKLYNNITSFKSLALASNVMLRDYINNTANDLRSNYIEILEKKKELKLEDINTDDLRKLDSLNLEEKHLLTKIYSNPKFKSYQPKNIDWQEIRNKLKPNEVAIEFINFSQRTGVIKNSEFYALLISPVYSSPQLVKLFKENDLNTLLSVNGDTKSRVNTIYNIHNEQLYKLIFEPLEKYLQENSNIYISKSGILHNISFSALTKNKSWNFTVLQNTKSLVEDSKPESSDQTVFFGGIDYGMGHDSVPKNSRKSKFFNRKFKKLNYTLTEVNKIVKLFNEASKKKSKIYSQLNASETAFRELSGSNIDIIHLATHGYYFKNEEFNSFIYENINNAQIELSPLLRSGLLLSGANNSYDKPTYKDGIITSQEISQLDLSNVNLVVLSACETGLGDVLGSEGVFGLQRAFKLAGAKSLIVSLWQVPDKQTSELMIQFYKYYLDGNSKSIALRKAQNDIKKKYPNPYFWAGFELIE